MQTNRTVKHDYASHGLPWGSRLEVLVCGAQEGAGAATRSICATYIACHSNAHAFFGVRSHNGCATGDGGARDCTHRDGVACVRTCGGTYVRPWSRVGNARGSHGQHDATSEWQWHAFGLSAPPQLQLHSSAKHGGSRRQAACSDSGVVVAAATVVAVVAVAGVVAVVGLLTLGGRGRARARRGRCRS